MAREVLFGGEGLGNDSLVKDEVKNRVGVIEFEGARKKDIIRRKERERGRERN